jgi:hypothetical protein
MSLIQEQESALHTCLIDNHGYWIGGSWEMVSAILEKIRANKVPGIGNLADAEREVAAMKVALAEPVGPDRRIDINGNIYTIAEALAIWQADLKRIQELEALLRDIRVCLGDSLIKDRINHALG